MRHSDDAVLTRLGGGSERFLAPHHLAAAERFEAMVRRAQLAPRLTMSYEGARTGGGKGAVNGVETASDSSADARLKLSKLASVLPADVWGVVFDVYGLGKGLQMIETERRWPRRSAKLVLRIGLDQLASQFGLSANASGRQAGNTTGWLEERLPLIAENSP